VRVVLQDTTHLLVLGSEVPCAVGDLCASVLDDLSADWNIGHAILSAVGVGRLEEGEDTGGCGEEEENQLVWVGVTQKRFHRWDLCPVFLD